MGRQDEEEREESTVDRSKPSNELTIVGPGSNKPVAPISRLLFSPREAPLLHGSAREGINDAEGLLNAADDV